MANIRPVKEKRPDTTPASFETNTLNFNPHAVWLLTGSLQFAHGSLPINQPAQQGHHNTAGRDCMSPVVGTGAEMATEAQRHRVAGVGHTGRI